MLEEVQMAPRLLDGVVHRAVALTALGAGKAAAGLEVDLDVEPLVLGVELGVRHHPGRHQPESELEQIDVAHMSVTPFVPFARHLAAVLAPVKTEPSAALPGRS